jgi:hypothetical protein
VFVVATATTGTIATVDVHDLDLACRVQKVCADETKPVSAGRRDLPAVRRHAPRLAAVGSYTATLPTLTQLNDLSCPEGYPLVLSTGSGASPQVCAPADPWTATSETWSVGYRAALPGTQIANGAFESADPSGLSLTLRAPAQLDLCARGVQVGDLVAVLGQPPKRLANKCPAPVVGSEKLLAITAAYGDHLELTPFIEGADDNALRAQRDEFVSCYPEFVGFEVRARDFVVLGRGTHLHRMVQDASGQCVVDASKDERYSSRLDPTTGAFKNPYLTFVHKQPAAGELPVSFNTTLVVSNGPVSLQENPSLEATATQADALPTALRYVPEVNRLFVVDSASQGLVRYKLRPFVVDGKPAR